MPSTPAPHAMPASAVDRAIALIREGRTITEAARAVGYTREGISQAMRKRGLRVADLRPVLNSHRGVSYGPRARRFACRYCGAPVTRAGVACSAPECQRRRQADHLAAHPEAKRTRYQRQLAYEEDQRREDGDWQISPNLRPVRQRREAIPLYVRPESADALRAYAAGRGKSMSAAVQEVLVEQGIIPLA